MLELLEGIIDLLHPHPDNSANAVTKLEGCTQMLSCYMHTHDPDLASAVVPYIPLVTLRPSVDYRARSVVAQHLQEIITNYGRSIVDNPRRLEALLRDYCGVHTRLIHPLIIHPLICAARSYAGDTSALAEARMVKRIVAKYAMEAETAGWAAGVLLEALISDEEK